MSHRGYAIAAYTVGALCSGSAIIAAQGALWVPAILCVFVGATFYELGSRERDAHKAARRAQEALEHAARPQDTNEPLYAPCCDYWVHTGGMGHNPRECRRSAA